MAQTRTLDPHDPLPDGRSVVLMRHFAEDEPDRETIELIVTRPDGGQVVSTPVGSGGLPLGWDQAIELAKSSADDAGLPQVLIIDRLAGPLERTIEAHGGDRSAIGGELADDDREDEIPGSDMRDQPTRQAPRKF